VLSDREFVCCLTVSSEIKRLQMYQKYAKIVQKPTDEFDVQVTVHRDKFL